MPPHKPNCRKTKRWFVPRNKHGFNIGDPVMARDPKSGQFQPAIVATIKATTTYELKTPDIGVQFWNSDGSVIVTTVIPKHFME